jgi:hypothetical protein
MGHAADPDGVDDAVAVEHGGVLRVLTGVRTQMIQMMP